MASIIILAIAIIILPMLITRLPLLLLPIGYYCTNYTVHYTGSTSVTATAAAAPVTAIGDFTSSMVQLKPPTLLL
jgi:hypothetical protein